MAANAGEVRARLVLDNAQFRQGVNQARQDMQGLSAGAASTAKGMSVLNTAAAATGVAVVAAVGASVKAAANFEQSMAKVKAISGATDTEFKQLSDTAKYLGETTQFSASQAADGLAFLSLAGFKAQDSINAMPAVLNLAAAGAIDLGIAADISSNIMTGFGIAAKDTGVAADILTKTFTTANTDMNQLGMAMKYVAPVANALGWEMTDAATAVAKMSDAGIQGSQAGTSLRAMLLSLANPTGQTAKAFEELGINVVNANGQFKPLPELIAHISSKMEGMTDAQKTVTAAQLVGTEASAGFLALIKQGAPALQEYKTSLEESGGTAERVAKIQQDTLMGAWTQMQSAAEGLAINLGTVLIPAFRALVETFTGVLSGLNSINPAFMAGGLAAAGFAATALLVVNNIGKVTNAMKLLGASLLTNPATAWIAGISLAVGALTAILVDSKEEVVQYKEVSMDAYRQMGEQAKSMETLATEYENLGKKINMTEEELLRYMQLQNDIKAAEDPETKKALQAELKGLTSETKATNEEIDQYIAKSGEIIKTADGTAIAYDKNGNAIAKNTDELRKLIEQKREQQAIELELQRIQAMANQSENIKKMTDATNNYNKLKKDSVRIEKEHKTEKEHLAFMEENLVQIEKEGSASKIKHAKEDIAAQKEKVAELDKQNAANKKAQAELQNQVLQIQKSKSEMEGITQAAIRNQLLQVDITAKRGEEVAKIKEAAQAQQEIIDKLEKQKAAGKELTTEEQAQLDKAKEKKGALDEAAGSVQKLLDDQKLVTDEYDRQLEKVPKLKDEMGKPVKVDVDLKTDEAKAKDQELKNEVKKGEQKPVDLEKSKADASNQKLNKDVTSEQKKKTDLDDSKARGKNDKLNKDVTKNQTKPVDADTSQAKSKDDKLTSDVKKKQTKPVDANTEHGVAKTKALDQLATMKKIKEILGNTSAANLLIDALNIRAEAKKTKKVDVDKKGADGQLNDLDKKATAPKTKRISLEWLGNLNPLKYFHSGGTVGASPSNRSTRPKYHNGGNPRGLVGGGAKFDEVDARLLKNEMVLTQAQQSNLFNFIRTANRPSVMASQTNTSRDKGGTGNVYQSNIHVAELIVREEADIEKIAEHLDRKRKEEKRARGY